MTIVSATAFAAPAVAQESEESGAPVDSETFVAPTPEQKQLNDQAVQALTAENYAKAVSFLEEALYIGELNVSYLNLGRAYQKMGECRKARQALEKVEGAPKVEKPPPEFIQKKAAEYLAELPDECPPAESATSEESDTAETDTETSDAEEVDGGAERADVDAPAKWPIGVVAGGGFVMVGGALALVAASTIRADAENQAAGAPDNGYTQSEFVAAERRANKLGVAGVATAAVGTLATGIGIYLLVSDTGQSTPEATVSVSPSADGAAAIFRVSF